MKTTGVAPEVFAASISLLSRSEMDAMPNSSRVAVEGHPSLANRRRAHPRGAEQSWAVSRRLLLCHGLKAAAGLRSRMKRRGGTMAESVRDAMTVDPRSIGRSVSVVEAALLMRQEDIGSLPITDNEK